MKMGSVRTRAGLYAVLICALVGIWGYVFVLLQAGLATSEPSSAAPLAEAVEEVRAVNRRVQQPGFAADFRDPFEWPPALVDPVGADTPVVQPSVPPPEAGHRLPVLQGVVGDAAMLEDVDAGVVFAAAGEVVGALRVVEVAVDHVVAEIEGQRHTLFLDP